MKIWWPQDTSWGDTVTPGIQFLLFSIPEHGGGSFCHQHLNSAPPAQWYFLQGSSRASTRASWEEPLSGSLVPMRQTSFGAATGVAGQVAWSIAGGQAVG